MRTRVPFDAPGQLIQFGGQGQLRRPLDKKWTPDINGFYSNRWQTGAGEFGIMADVAYSHVKTLSQGIQYGRTAIVTNGSPDWPATAYFPASIDFLNSQYDRKRYGISGAAQWKSNGGKVLVTGQYLRSLYKNNWKERNFGDWNLGPDLYGYNVRTTIGGPLNGGGNLSGRVPVQLPALPTSRSTPTVISRAAPSFVTIVRDSSGGAHPDTQRWLRCE